MLFVLLVVLTMLFVVFVVRQLLLQRRIAARRVARQQLTQTTDGGAYHTFVGDTDASGALGDRPVRGSDDDA